MDYHEDAPIRDAQGRPVLSPVELIAEALLQHEPAYRLDPENLGYEFCRCGETYLAGTGGLHLAAAIAASVRSWPAPTQAQLIGGYVVQFDPDDEGDKTAIFLADTQAPAQLIGDTE